MPAKAQMAVQPAMLQQLQFNDELGQPYSLAQYYGQPILLHLWATWCAPCIREIPLLVQLQTDYAPFGLVLLPVSQDFSPQDVASFYRQNNILNLPLLLDRDSILFKALGTRGLPISILIDRNGYEIRRFAGNTNWNSPQVRGMLNGLLAR
jgi:thiol-disulfide isomerase/thioredoxin